MKRQTRAATSSRLSKNRRRRRIRFGRAVQHAVPPRGGEAAISVSSRAVAGDPLWHTVRAVGNVTQALARLQPGDTFGLRGPFGSCWPIDQITGCDVVFVTGGIGLAPLRPAIYHVLDHRDSYGAVSLLYGARTPDTILYPSEFAAWRAAGIDVQVTVDRATPDWRDMSVSSRCCSIAFRLLSPPELMFSAAVPK